MYAYTQFDDTRLIMLHGSANPTHDQWDEYMKLLSKKDVAKLGVLVFTDGGSPNASQRKQMNDIVQRKPFARAIVTSSPLVRGVLRAVSWFSVGVAGFEPSDWRLAAAHAKFKEEELPALVHRTRKLHAEIGNIIPWLDDALAR